MQKCHHSVENCCENRDNVWNLCEYIPGHKRNNQDAPFEMAIDGAYICDTAVSSTMTTETVSCFPHTMHIAADACAADQRFCRCLGCRAESLVAGTRDGLWQMQVSFLACFVACSLYTRINSVLLLPLKVA